MFLPSAFIKVQQSWGKQEAKQAEAFSWFTSRRSSARHGDRSYRVKHKVNSCIEEKTMYLTEGKALKDKYLKYRSSVQTWKGFKVTAHTATGCS